VTGRHWVEIETDLQLDYLNFGYALKPFIFVNIFGFVFTWKK